ncbi:LuxR C-terminal-related transcriptional regulator [Vibrio sp. J1-1]|uniref:LuxR C-terminal-related transcriptional regulator n=1 Tax=Vibrio sp. J1-1 TaxID=2912251 RepID=UPI001F0326AD|nr:LuxR C-terminal-related transcriptional regulator [Vibrio sp. J1-1]MCF7480326.1 LuxR C-terminal-related transcriptional regulator [Vibrio sp. J1-1]
MEYHTTGDIILITEGSLQSSLLKDVLEMKLGISVVLITPENLTSRSIQGQLISAIILDFSILTEDIRSLYRNFKKSELRGIREILINCDGDVSTEDLFIWNTLAGIFYTSDDFQTLQTGIDKILQGDMWFSRKFSQQYITHLRQNIKPVYNHDPSILTRREMQIITFLAMGASNQEIAEQLFVSENTVKTHLHNIFKKIEVKNRVQALIWAKENIAECSMPV